ncbi:MAG: oligopeptide transport system substrate-binding protein [Actinoplanes sp.]|nr:oligopeptide transport system substrate-binding protein [Actinoplanes sp.]
MFGNSPWKMAVSATVIALSAAGCSGTGSDDNADYTNSAIIGIVEPQHLLPSNTTDAYGGEVLESLFYPLVEFDEAKQPVERAAQSITSPDNKVWTVKLKKDFTFSNGEPVTSDNYLNAWNYAAYGPNAQDGSYYFERIEGYADLQSKDPDGAGPAKAATPKTATMSGLKKIDDLTFQITLSAPFAGWKSVIAYTVFLPLPDAAFTSPGVIKDGYEQAPIGNGPFKMKGSWEHDNQIQVVRRDDFKGTRPKVAGVIWKIYQDQQSEYADLVAGNVDVQTTIPIESLASAPGDLGERFQKSPNSSFQFVGFPTYQTEFSNPDVRKAISMAVDRKEMTSQIFLDSQTPATSFVSPAVNGYRADVCGAACKYEPAKAKALYQRAGGPSALSIAYNADGPHKAWVDAMCNQIRASLGVQCNGAPQAKFSDLLTKAENKQPVGMLRLGWLMDYPLMESYLGPLYSTNGSANYWGYSSPAFDNLVTEGDAAKTPADSIKKWQQAEDLLAEDMPVIPLRFGQNVYGYSERASNVSVDLFQQVDIYKIEIAPTN